MGKLPLTIAMSAASAAFAAPSVAVTLNAKGLGQVLIFPYYTVNKGQATLLSLVNVSQMGKAVHVYFEEGYNGRDVLDFVVFLSPYDVWTGAVTSVSDDGGAKITSADKSCVLPANDANGNDFASGMPFSTAGFDDTSFIPDGGPTSVTRTREGFIYVVTNGDLDPQSATAQLITHVQNGTPDGGAPAGCSQTSGLVSALNGADLQVPASTLAGSAAIIDVANGIFFGYNPDALSDFTAVPLTAASSTVGFDDLRHANSAGAITPIAATAYVSSGSGLPLALEYEQGIDAVSAVLSAGAIYNEYLVGGSIGANTDWVVTMPTKHFYVDPRYIGNLGVIAPFTEVFGETIAGQSRSNVEFAIHDREEGLVVGCADLSCPVPQPSVLAFETNVISFVADPSNTLPQAPSPVLGSQLVSSYVSPYGTDGWASMDLGDVNSGYLMHAAANGIALEGLPVTGFMVYNVVNTNAQPGKLANYGSAFPHRSTIACASDPTFPPPCLR